MRHRLEPRPLSPATRPCIVWDFDGTLLPSAPHDSEQALMLARMAAAPPPRAWIRRLLTPLVVEADRRQVFTTSRRRRFYLQVYPWLLKGTPEGFLEGFARKAAAGISDADRHALRALKADGYPMVVVSCGTADLSERVLRLAGIDRCFEWVAGNRLRFAAGEITGLEVRLATAMSKVMWVYRAGIDLAASAAVGDGYTDLPLLDRAAIPIMMDPTGERRREFGTRGYHFAAGIGEAAAVVARHAGKQP